jgi:hypothetical protein
MPPAAEKTAALSAVSTNSGVQSQPVTATAAAGSHWGERFDRWFFGDLATLGR